MMPKAGGQYVFLREGLSPAAGFLYGWTLFAVIQTGTIAAVAVAFARFLSVLVPAVSPDVFLPLGQVRLPGAADAIQLGLSPQRVVAILSILLLTGDQRPRRRARRGDPDGLHRRQGGRARGAGAVRPHLLPPARRRGGELRRLSGAPATGPWR